MENRKQFSRVKVGYTKMFIPILFAAFILALRLTVELDISYLSSISFAGFFIAFCIAINILDSRRQLVVSPEKISITRFFRNGEKTIDLANLKKIKTLMNTLNETLLFTDGKNKILVDLTVNTWDENVELKKMMQKVVRSHSDLATTNALRAISNEPLPVVKPYSNFRIINVLWILLAGFVLTLLIVVIGLIFF